MAILELWPLSYVPLDVYGRHYNDPHLIAFLLEITSLRYTHVPVKRGSSPVLLSYYLDKIATASRPHGCFVHIRTQSNKFANHGPSPTSNTGHKGGLYQSPDQLPLYTPGQYLNHRCDTSESALSMTNDHAAHTVQSKSPNNLHPLRHAQLPPRLQPRRPNHRRRLRRLQRQNRRRTSRHRLRRRLALQLLTRRARRFTMARLRTQHPRYLQYLALE